MKNALLAVVLMTPLFALLGTAVVSKRMAFFSDVLGHSALTGVALGVLLGMSDPFWAMLMFIIILAVTINIFKNITHASSDTVLGVFFAITVASGVMILSKGGGFNKFTGYLIGDILAVSPKQLAWMAVFFLVILLYWVLLGNKLLLINVNPSLARSRGINVSFIETSFVIVLAILVAVSLRIIGILMINSLLVLPAAAARNLATNTRRYTLWSILISVISGICGLILSYYCGTASSATIIVFCAVFYFMTVILARIFKGT
ncbi:MAG: metal ABC transporter permease [candidate division Zixibacteria bacterium]|nr:metal ABC transporter permease [candidate division Zixibacteria bacterium]